MLESIYQNSDVHVYSAFLNNSGLATFILIVQRTSYMLEGKQYADVQVYQYMTFNLSDTILIQLKTDCEVQGLEGSPVKTPYACYIY